MTLLRRSIGLVLSTYLASAGGVAWSQGTPQVSGAWQRLYEQLPNFPQENQYRSRETGSIKTSNTLANRLIQYHVFVKGRSPSSRLDWKLTMADYLGVNEVMFETRYPGVAELKTSPYERDRTIIQQLSRSQREELVQAMVSVLTPGFSRSSTVPTDQTESAPSPTPNSPRLYQSPKAGDADLLKP